MLRVDNPLSSNEKKIHMIWAELIILFSSFLFLFIYRYNIFLFFKKKGISIER